MTVAALLCWYDERPDWLYEAVSACAAVGITQLAALDGRYELFHGKTASSDEDQWEAIAQACTDAGMAMRIRGPEADRPWKDEPEKRTALFRLGDEMNASWYFILDADEFVRPGPDLPTLLEAVTADAAECVFVHPGKRVQGLRNLFRATPGITVVGRHWTFVHPDGRYLWGPTHLSVIDAPVLTDFIVDHRPRPVVGRTARKLRYYNERNLSQAEFDACDRCKVERAARRITRDGRVLVLCRRCFHLGDHKGEAFA